MPTFNSLTADAGEASEALPGLAHATRVFEDPADTDRREAPNPRALPEARCTAATVDPAGSPKAHLEDCLALVGDMHAIDGSIHDSRRRICDRAFFERIHVYEFENADRVEAEPGEPFDTLLDPAVHAAALAYEASVRAGEDVKPEDVASLTIDTGVGPAGIEPTTSTV